MFLLTVEEDEAAHLAQPPHEMAALLEAQRRFAADVRDELVDHGRFRGTGLAQFYWLRTASLERALELSRALPVLDSDELDVRPVMSGFRHDRLVRGKIFGYVVRGRALSEAGWTAAMDTIDAETRAELQAAPSVGGVRLHPPSTGRRVVRRAVVDGPFMESKEVLGGLFFLRMASLEDAIEWAAHSRYVVHGTLEVRELWR